jgi:Outer membrane protein beta-barrel domain
MLIVLAAVAMLAPRLAHAQAATEPPWNARMWYGAELKVSPIGSNTITSPGREGTFDLNTMYTLVGVFDFRALPFVSIGVAPSLTFNYAFLGNGMLFDLPARVTVGAQVAPGTRLYTFGTAGYEHSTGFPSDDPNGESSRGFVVGAGVGVAHRIMPKLAVTGEIGYQVHYMTASIFDDEHVDISLRLRCLSLSIGLMAPID